uniref:OVATE domain-containing protein n=1 Tax=Kalanchoe fedtschenkoi TaxID=63787 RepID=A0A7N0TIB0_KALFE
MPLRRTRKKTSEFFKRTIKGLKSIFHHGRQTEDAKAPQPRKPFSCSSRTMISKDVCVKGEYYSDRWMDEYGHGSSAIATKDKVIVVSTREQNNNVGLSKECFKKDEDWPKDDAMMRKMDQGVEKEDDGCLKKQGSYRFSQRMKELEMLEFKDVDHVLDVEEVLHYYSRLRSPVYLDIVDSFFTDMYAELHKPHRSGKGTSLHGSQRRLGPVKL